jgi:hypothetical protein
LVPLIIWLSARFILLDRDPLHTGSFHH